MQALVVDDSRAMRQILGNMLRSLGFDVVEAANGREGLTLLKTLRPDVALVDWNMPVMDGLEFIQTLRRDPRHRELPLLMVTSETEMEQVVAALEAGANEYLMKPFDPEAVSAKLQILGIL